MSLEKNDQVIDVESYEETNGQTAEPMIVNRQANSDDDDLYGMVVNSPEEAYKLYNQYAIRLGFSIRKTQRRSINNVLRQVNFACSKEGFRVESDPSEVKKTDRLDTRTGCLARIRFSLQDNNVWKVTLFDREHNHEFASPVERQFLRSNGNITKAQAG